MISVLQRPPVAPARAPARVVILGGGCSGAAVAVHLAAVCPVPCAVTIVEPRPVAGMGLAYGTEDPAHRINVPAAKMSLFPDDPGHFERWLLVSGELAHDRAATLPDGRIFPRRAMFGRYVVAHLRETAPFTHHLQDRAVAVSPVGPGYLVQLESGRAIEADLLVLAISNPPPSVPATIEAALASDPRLVADPWAPDALARIATHDRVLVVGTGLTMADIVASLAARGHRGPITAFSRRGLLPRGHTDMAGDPFGELRDPPVRSAVALLHRVRATVGAAAAAGLPWQHVLDAARAQGPDLWAALPSVERRRLLRHARPFWDTHRYRIAPQVEAVLNRLAASGQLEVVAAAARTMEAEGDAVRAVLALRRSSREVTVDADAVVLATGPAHGSVLRTIPALAALAAEGLVTADPVGLGLAVDPQSRAIDAQGRVRPCIFVSGPLARGRFGELMGLPEIVAHARDVASRLAGLVHQAGLVPMEPIP